VQIGAFSNKPDRSKFNGVKYEFSNEEGLTKVLTGNFKNFEDAQKRKDELKEKGFDAFVVGYEKGKRIAIK
jgi:cell division septation protein DedD